MQRGGGVFTSNPQIGAGVRRRARRALEEPQVDIILEIRVEIKAARVPGVAILDRRHEFGSGEAQGLWGGGGWVSLGGLRHRSRPILGGPVAKVVEACG